MRRSWRTLAALTALLLATGCTSTTLATSPVRVSTTAQTQPAPVTSRSALSATSRSARPAPATPAAATLRSGRAPTGFWSGSDSWPVPVSGSGPYREPGIGGAYGGYIGMAGSWSYWLGCRGGFLAWSSANSAQADTNYTRYGQGIGTAVYWFMGGPGVDPGYNGTRAEASTWGARQAARTLANMAKEHVTYPVVFMDIELPGVAPAFDNGWDDVYTSACSGVVKHRGIPAALARADFNGFFNYVSAHSSYKVGVYSNAATWTQIFGTGAAGAIPHTYEWTYEPETAHLSDAPRGWCLKSGGCAQFFGGVTSTSARALMWQWSGGGGVRNAIGDFDQIDATRQS
jgi:hypothetical protein